MSEEELIETLRAFEKNRVEQLEEPAKNLFYAIMEIADERDRLNNTIKGLDNTIENLEEVIKHKDSIIKEAREYIGNNKASLPMGRDEFTYEMRYSDPVVLANKLLEILDKVEEK